MITQEELDELIDELMDELQYLRWFRSNADFGPAHGDVIRYMNQDYVKDTGDEVPKRWSDE